MFKMNLLTALLLLIVLALSACAPVTMEERLADGGLASIEELTAAARLLPDADVVAVDGFRLLYPAGTLFGRSALIPSLEAPGSTAPLVDFFGRFAAHDWKFIVRAGLDRGDDYARKLADKRVSQLKLLLEQHGFNVGDVAWETAAGEGVPVEVRAGKVRRQLPKTNPG